MNGNKGLKMSLNNETPDDALLSAIERGDLAGVKKALAAGADAGQGDSDNWSPLHLAAIVRLKSPEIINLLLDHGVDVNMRDAWGMTPLHRAAGANRAFSVQAFIDNGADITIVDEDGQTAFHRAVYKNAKAIAISLLEAGIDTEIRDKSGKTALDIAVEAGHVEFEKLIADFRAQKEKERQAIEKQEAEALAVRMRFENNLKKIDALPGRRRPNFGGGGNGG